MKKSQKGFVGILVSIIVVLFVIIGIVYFYNISNSSIPITNQDVASGTSTDQQNQTSTIASTSSAKQYTDADFGFSFWYPSDWQVSEISPSTDTDSNIQTGKVMSILVLGEKDTKGNTKPEIYIQKVHSSSMIITDTFGISPNQTYFFNSKTHTWMTSGYDSNGKLSASTTANVSVNTMGGLHIFGSSGQDSTYGRGEIVPLSADNFVVVNNIGVFDANFLTNTILATDPSVATPISFDGQNKIVQQELNSFTQTKQASSELWKTYVDSNVGFSFQYPNKFYSDMASLNYGQSGTPEVFTTSTSTSIGTNGCYVSPNAPMPEKNSSVTLNNVNFCLSSSSDAGMSQLYTNYYYTTHQKGNYITIGYLVHTSNGCGVYSGDPIAASCNYFFKNYSDIVTKNIEKSLESLIFTK